DFAAIDADGAVGDGQDQRTIDRTLDVNVVGDFLGGRQDLAEELHFARTQGAAAAGIALPAEVEAYQLPHGVEAQAARHDGVAFEVAGEEPQVRVDIQLGDQFALAVLAADITDVG